MILSDGGIRSLYCSPFFIKSFINLATVKIKFVKGCIVKIFGR